ncbi:MAG: molybdopterin-guanine dinucleotide biosynthesis protein B [Oscillibacter sp.]|nr:molybdopterin-guanine dinucleotide biosynthesis protein B [Oscillibacter sp.]MBQ7778808.1 molybdopterin-guanine dinucleotide biosynthesis protein B [Oscillibacter sp.]
MDTPVFIFAAYSNVGKTTYLERLIPCLKEAGLRVGVVKHDAHDFQLDIQGKDTWRFAAAGADTVAIASASHFALFRQCAPSLEEILAQFTDVDLILVEGFKQARYPKIALFRADSGKPLAAEPASCVAVVTDTPVEAPCPCFPLNDPKPLAEHLLRTLHAPIPEGDDSHVHHS